MEELKKGSPNTNPSCGREEDLNSEHPDYKFTRPNDIGIVNVEADIETRSGGTYSLSCWRAMTFRYNFPSFCSM